MKGEEGKLGIGEKVIINETISSMYTNKVRKNIF